MDYKVFRERLIEAANGMQWKDVAKLIEVNPATLSKWLNKDDGYHVTAEQLFRISEKLNVSVDYLIGRTDHKTISDFQRVIASIDYITARLEGCANIRLRGDGMFNVEIDASRKTEAPFPRYPDASDIAFALTDYYHTLEQLSAVKQNLPAELWDANIESLIRVYENKLETLHAADTDESNGQGE